MKNPYADNFDQNNNQKRPSNTDDLQLVRFDRQRRLEEIQNAEEQERQRRRAEQIRRRKAEKKRQIKIARIKGVCLLAVIAIALIFAVVGIVSAITKAVKKSGGTSGLPDGYVSEAESTLVSGFIDSKNIIIAPEDNAVLRTADDMLTSITLSRSATVNIPQNTVKIDEYGELSERYSLFSTSDQFAFLKNSVKNAPIYTNGYMWSENESIKSSLTGGYMYDTNSSFISAVANICLWEGGIDFLSEIDSDEEPKLDVSKGMTVREKLEKAVGHYFDGDIAGGGIKYDPISSLVYIHTANNNGTSSGNSSNKWYNFRFGYLDGYTNISFNRAMQDLSKLYSFMGLEEESQTYADIAQKNARAFNEKFWSKEKGRYVGCFDKNGASYDYGFVFLNLEAIEAGIADTVKTADIFSWLDGTRLIESDTAKGSDIYAYGFAPRNTTVPAEDTWWDYLGGLLPLSGDGGYNRYYQNGGASLYTEYYDIMARYAAGSDTVKTRLASLASEFSKSGFASGYESAVYNISGNALSGLTPVAYLKTVFGIDTDGFRLYVSPDLSFTDTGTEVSEESSAIGSFGIKGIDFAKNSYGFLFDDGKVYVTATFKSPVRMSIGGFEESASYDIVTVEDGMEIERKPITSSGNGIIDIAENFGNTSYLKIERTSEEQKK